MALAALRLTLRLLSVRASRHGTCLDRRVSSAQPASAPPQLFVDGAPPGDRKPDTARYVASMCNLYNARTNQRAIHDGTSAARDLLGTYQPLPGIYPTYPAPIFRTAADGVRELAAAWCGNPGPAIAPTGCRRDRQWLMLALRAFGTNFGCACAAWV